MMHERRNEALLVLQLHRIERAAVGINADEETVLGTQVEHASFVLEQEETEGTERPLPAMMLSVPSVSSCS